MSKKDLPLILQGTPVSPGLAQGIIHVHRGLLGPIDVPVDIEPNNVEEEFSRLDAATASISDDLFALATRVEKEIDTYNYIPAIKKGEGLGRNVIPTPVVIDNIAIMMSGHRQPGAMR